MYPIGAKAKNKTSLFPLLAYLQIKKDGHSTDYDKRGICVKRIRAGHEMSRPSRGSRKREALDVLQKKPPYGRRRD